MKTLLLITLTALSFNASATALLVAATCTGTVEMEDEVSYETTIYAQENHMNYCEHTEMDTTGALVSVDKYRDSGFDDSPGVNIAQISVGENYETTYTSTIDENNSMKLIYTFNNPDGTLIITYDGQTTTTKMNCTFIMYNMDC